MASTQVMSTAPESFFADRQSLEDYVRGEEQKQQQQQQQPEQDYQGEGSLAPSMTAPVQGGEPLRSAPVAGEAPPSYQWRGMGMTLASLEALAASLSSSDAEITPVQAWFELVERYTTADLLAPTTMALLKQELRGVVDCVHFGAVMERQAFESVVGRVLGPW